MERQRIVLIGGGAAVVLLALCLVLRGCGDPQESDPSLARVQKLERHKDIAGLTAAIKDPDAKVAARAVIVLASVAGKQAQSVVEQSMKDPRLEVRAAAVEAYGQAGERNKTSVLDSVITDDESPGVRAVACQSAARIYAWESVEPLMKALEDKDRLVRESAIAAMERMVGGKLPAYRAEGDKASRAKAIEQIRKLLPGAKRQYDGFVQQLERK